MATLCHVMSCHANNIQSTSRQQCLAIFRHHCLVLQACLRPHSPYLYHLLSSLLAFPGMEWNTLMYDQRTQTRQARDVEESRYMYDQLAVLSPVMLALTAATPILKGRLVDTDVRWNTIATSVDDRTPAERGLLGGDDDPVRCSRRLGLGFIPNHITSHHNAKRSEAEQKPSLPYPVPPCPVGAKCMYSTV